MTTLFTRFLIVLVIVRVISAVVIVINIVRNHPDIAYYTHDRKRLDEEVGKLKEPFNLYISFVNNSIYASILGIVLSLIIL